MIQKITLQQYCDTCHLSIRLIWFDLQGSYKVFNFVPNVAFVSSNFAIILKQCYMKQRINSDRLRI